jgi:RNA polymerase sigma-70 factor (ECF subfamily)
MKLMSDCENDELLAQAELGDSAARQQLLEMHRPRLRLMVAVRLDRRLSARVDPSDVVQDALTEANQALDEYLKERPLPFYPWLRRFAWKRLVDLHRRHVVARRRTVTREESLDPGLPDHSAVALADNLMASDTSPSRHVLRDELVERVQSALGLLDARDREVLVLRYLEQLTTAEIAAVLGIGVGAVKMRHLRALQRLRAQVADHSGEDAT